MIKRFRLIAPMTVILAATLIPAVNASASVPLASFTFSSRSLEISQSVTANLCASRGSRGDVLSYQEAFGTHRRWSAIYQKKLTRSTQCFSYTYAEKSQGQYQFRLELVSNGRKLSLSGLKRLDVFGPISILQFRNSVGFNCDGSSPVSSGGHLYQTFCSFQAGNSYRSGARSSCRSMTLSLIATDDTSGANPGGGTATLQIQQSTLNAQNLVFADDTLTAETIQLDGSQFQLNFSDTNGNAYLYLVSTGTADCYTVTGAA